MLTTVPSILLALFALSVLILVHELGHLLAAKISGVWAEEFGIGLPPRLFGKKIGDTIYSVNALPFGGFVRLHGETGDAKVTKGSMAYVNKSRTARIFIALGGIFMNFLLAILAFTFVISQTGIARGIKIVSVAPNSPAEEIGLLENDQIVSLAGIKIKDYEDFYPLVADHIGSTVEVVISRDSEEFAYQVELREDPPEDEGAMGIAYLPAEQYRAPIYLAPIVYPYYGVQKTIMYSVEILKGFKLIFGQLFGGTVPQGVAGPVGVTAIMTEIAKVGILPLVEFAGIISINLALLNLVPFPPLDGSRVAFILSEYFISKKKVQKYENYIYTAGFVLLIGLLVLVTANEVPSLLRADSLSSFVDGIVSQ